MVKWGGEYNEEELSVKQYLDMERYILEHGEKREDRTGTGTISVFGYQARYDLKDSFPIMTTKKMYLRPIAEELLWFLKGDTNIKYLVDRNVKIWNDWPYARYTTLPEYQGETMEEFVEKIKNSDEFAAKYGNLGPVYGAQWRNYNGEGCDQIARLIDGIRNNPFSRRHIICAWNPLQVDDMALPPCHTLVQFYVSADGKYLSSQLYQRSADTFLGVPFNITSYALLTAMVAQVCGLKPKEFVHTTGDTHIYLDHVDVVKTQLEREPLPLPTLWINPEVKNIEDFTIDDFKLENYQSHGRLRGKVSV